MDILIVTPDLVGPVANGGIGTSCTALAQFLATLGLEVHVLFTLDAALHRAPSESWRALYDGVEVWALDLRDIDPPIPSALHPNHAHLVRSYRIYQWLKPHRPRIIIFMDWQGEAFYSVMAKRTGLAFLDTWIVVQAHSPSIWHSIFSQEPIDHPNQLLTSHLERRSVEHADLLISPSDYMISWMRQSGWSLPQSVAVLQNLIPQGPAGGSGEAKAGGRIDHVVFFGRLERRKGLDYFCDAVDVLLKTHRALPEITFLGKFGRVGREHSAGYILGRAQGWPAQIHILNHFDQPSALSWLGTGGKLAIMPSAMDNSPYTVVECISAGIPFVARDVGGVGELIDPADRPRCLVGDNPAELAARIADLLEAGVQPVRPSASQVELQSQWQSLVSELLSHQPPSARVRPASRNPLISICIVHKDRPELLGQALQSVFLQTYTNLEVVLVDDGSETPSSLDLLEKLRLTFERRGWKIIRQRNQYLGHARNTAAAHAAGDWILFLDDDNVCRLNHVEVLHHAAAASGADVVVSMMDVFLGQDYPGNHTEIIERFMPLGDAVAYGVFANGFGDACALYRRSTFLALEGFTTDWGVGSEDHELFARAVLSGAKLVVVPEPLFWYRRHGTSMLHSTSGAAGNYRALRPYLATPGADLREIALLSQNVMSRGARRRLLDPVIGLLRQALALVSQDRITGQMREAFARARALAIMADSVCTLNDRVEPDSAAAAAIVRLLYLCCGRRDAVEHLFGDRAPIPYQATDPEIDAAIAAFDRAAAGGKVEPERASLLERRALLASAWRLGLDETVIAALEQSLAPDDPAQPALLIEALVDAAVSGRREGVESSVHRLLVLADAEYLDVNTDVADAVARGDIRSGADHYLLFGMSEGRRWALGELALQLAARALSQ